MNINQKFYSVLIGILYDFNTIKLTVRCVSTVIKYTMSTSQNIYVVLTTIKNARTN